MVAMDDDGDLWCWLLCGRWYNNEGDIFVDDVAVVFDINDAGCCDDIGGCDCNCDDNDGDADDNDNVETAI